MSTLKLYEMDAVMAALSAYRRELPAIESFNRTTLKDALLDLRSACGIVLDNLAEATP